MRPVASVLLCAAFACANLLPAAHAADDCDDAALSAALAGPSRSADNRARDAFRHPCATLAFFGLKPDMTVIEITPGGGWYTEILAPYLRADGHYVGAIIDPASAGSDGARKYYASSNAALRTLLDAAPAQYDRAELRQFDHAAPVLGPPASADAVLTFRNVHNWRMAGDAEAMFAAFFAVLKPGGVLGVVEHRAAADVADGDRSGYVGRDQLVAAAQAAGFELEAESDLNANPKDTHQHPNGVWTLPPTNRHDAADDAKYQAIGESDRMTLRFRKPKG